MEKKIKVVYDWMGPSGPIANGFVPNVYTFSSVVPDTVTHDTKRHLQTSSYHNFFSRFPDIFEISPSFSIKHSDTFIYELRMYHWIQPERFFTYNDVPGIFESSHISGHLLNCVINGKGYILIDNSFEALVHDAIFKKMHLYFESYAIPLNKVIYQVGAANAAEMYENYCKINGVPENNRMKVVFWDMIEWNISLSARNLPHKPGLKRLQNIEKTFLVFNRRYRTHRTKLTLLFKKYNLLHGSFYSMPRNNADGGGTNFMNQVDWSFVDAIGMQRNEVDELFSMLPLSIDDPTDLNDMINVINGKPRNFYEKSMVTLITETFFETDIISVTEKSFKPIFYKQPFIMVGAPRSLEYMQRKGYKTFSKWWDESYDTELNHDRRLVKIAELCNTINNWSVEQKENFLLEVVEVLEHNYQTFLNRSSTLENSFWLTLGENL